MLYLLGLSNAAKNVICDGPAVGFSSRNDERSDRWFEEGSSARVPAGYREPAGTFRKLSDYCVLLLRDLQIVDDLLYALRVPRELFGVRLLLR